MDLAASLYGLARPLLFRLDPERAHRLALGALGTGLVRPRITADPPSLALRAFGLAFANPVGLAAGFDKNAEAPGALLRLGFGFIELGTVTPQPQAGNPRPRLFRLPEERALINRLGFNNSGLARMRARLAARPPGGGIIGVNLGANRDSADRSGDYVAGLDALYSYADYFTINVSSPNTPGLRALQEADALDDLLARLSAARARLAQDARPKPLLVKIAPDLSAESRAALAEIVPARGMDGLIVGNTSTGLRAGLRGRYAAQTGGLSGPPLFALSTAVLADIYRRTGGRIPLVGVGGINSGADAYCKIRAGASVVQIYTALIYQGPGLVARVKREVAACLARDGLRHVGAAVGLDAGRLAPPQEEESR
jgi:dihydroorotate dehydrogenase